MKRTANSRLAWLLIAGMCFFVGAHARSFGQVADEGTAADEAATPAQPSEETAGGDAADVTQEHRLSGGAPWARRAVVQAAGRLMRQAVRMRHLVKKECNLNAEQVEAIDQLVDDHIAHLKACMALKPPYPGGVTDPLAIESLNEDIKYARMTGDKQAAREAYQELLRGVRVQIASMGESTSDLMSAISDKLTTAQRAPFIEIIQGIRKDQQREPKSPALGALLAALQDPQVGLTPERQDELTDRVNGAVLDIPAGSMDVPTLTAVASSMKQTFASEMDEAQRAQFEKVYQERLKPAPRQPKTFGPAGRRVPIKKLDEFRVDPMGQKVEPD